MRIAKGVVLSVALLGLVTACMSAPAMAQGTQAKPKFLMLPPHNIQSRVSPSGTLPYFTITYPTNGTPTKAVMVGTSTNTTTTIPVVMIPFALTCGTHTTDPLTVLSNGRTVIQNIIDSPLFQNMQWTQGGTNLGNTQYIDAYQKGSLWQKAKNANSYHVLLGQPSVATEISLTVPSDKCTYGNPGLGNGSVVVVNLNWMDAEIQQAINSNSSINPGVFPIAVTYDLYLTEIGHSLLGCCVGGYHSAYGGTGSQTYSQATYMPPGTNQVFFAQDTGALSHEIGEWYEDPFINNSGCGGLLEVGDPLETLANYGDYPYTLNGYTYQLQDLVFFPYFWQTPSQAVNGWYTFQNENVSVCSNGQ